jgi:hypothetical protein
MRDISLGLEGNAVVIRSSHYREADSCISVAGIPRSCSRLTVFCVNTCSPQSAVNGYGWSRGLMAVATQLVTNSQHRSPLTILEYLSSVEVAHHIRIETSNPREEAVLGSQIAYRAYVVALFLC